MFLKAAVCVTLFVYVNAFAGHVTEKYPHKVAINANFTLYWKASASDITFEAHVRTQGWAAIGFTADGTMFPGDAVMGYVSDDGKGVLNDYHTVGHRPPMKDSSKDYTLLASGRVHTGTMLKFSRPIDTHAGNNIDYHTVGHRPPMKDSSQDYTLLASGRVHTGTMLKFSRPIDTQDSNDMTLQTGNQWVIWGSGDVDPVTSVLHYHGANRGATQLALLGSSVAVGK